MGTQSNFSVYIDKDIYKGEYSDIKEELKEVFIQIGHNLGWDLKDSNSETVVFKTPFSMRSIGETVTVNYYTNKVFITSVSNQKSVWTTWGKNDENCEKYLSKIVPSVKEYLNSKESNRQSSNKELLDIIRKDILEITTNKDLFKLISDNQNKIEKTYLPNFIKIYQFYEEQVNTYNIIYNNINDLEFHTLSSRSIEYSIETIKIYSSTIEVLDVTIKQLFESYLSEDLINFYTLYNKFEEMGLFLSKGEKLMVRSLNDINENMDSLIGRIDGLVDTMSDMGKTLEEINSGIGVSNLLSTINTYQLYKINQNMKRVN